MNGLTVVFGMGAIGHLVTEKLLERGDRVRVAQRHQPSDVPDNMEYVACDILDAEAVRRAVQGASQILLSVGFAYDSQIWKVTWPKAISNIVEAGAEAGCRIVFIDNLYQLGPQDSPRTEDMALTNVGQKPVILADVTRVWMAARDRVRFAALRCPDFYGPGIANSHLGASAFGQMASGKAALMVVPVDTLHDFAYAPDIARAAVSLLDAPDDAFGQVWNVPCAPTLTPRHILKIGAEAIGSRLNILEIPLWLLPIAGMAMRFMREVYDVRFTWNRPFHVDSRKFQRRFWSDVTPFEIGAALTARSFLSADAAS